MKVFFLGQTYQKTLNTIVSYSRTDFFTAKKVIYTIFPWQVLIKLKELSEYDDGAIQDLTV